MPQLPRLRWHRGALLSLVLAGAACETSDGLTTVPITPPTLPADSIARVRWTLPTPAAFASDSVRLVIRGPDALRQGRLLLRDATTKAVVVTGPLRGLQGTRDTLRLALGTAGLTSGQRFEAFAEIRYADGSVRYSADADSSVTEDIEDAAGPTSTFYVGRSVTLDGQTIGGAAVDPLRGWLLLSLSDRNRVVALDAGAMRLFPWHAPTGATPGRIAYHPTAWGPGGTAVVVNTGGTDLSIVDVDATGASERQRISLPSLVLRTGGDSALLAPRALRLTPWCERAPCSLPEVLVSVGEATGRAGLLRLQPATGTLLGALLPGFAGRAPDISVQTSLAAQLTAGTYTTLAATSAGSRCGSERLGPAWFGQGQRGGEPLGLMVLTPDLPSLCSGAGRLQRWERQSDGAWRSDAPTLSLTGGEAQAPATGLTDFLVSEDGALTIAVASGRTIVFGADGRHRGTLPGSGETHVALLHDEFGAPLALGVLQGGAVQFYAPTTLQPTLRVSVPPGFGRGLYLVPTGGTSFLLAVGGTAPARLWMLPLTVSSLGNGPTTSLRAEM